LLPLAELDAMIWSGQPELSFFNITFAVLLVEQPEWPPTPIRFDPDL
jgi:hypothetical protein